MSRRKKKPVERYPFHLIIDLEMCMVPEDSQNEKFRHRHEIIQIGAVLLDEQYREIGTLRQYVKPVLGSIDAFIEELTGITNAQVEYAPQLQEALNHMLDWIGDRKYRVLTWSQTDHYQLKYEIAGKEIQDERIAAFMDPAHWVDYQKVFGKKYGCSHSMALKNALELCEISPDGRLHDGLTDALNTARIVEKLEKLEQQEQQAK